jgi:hypothetical protein
MIGGGAFLFLPDPVVRISWIMESFLLSKRYKNSLALSVV